MHKKVLEIFVAIAFVVTATAIAYQRLARVESFWDAQFLWNLGLVACWIVVAMGYYHQGWLVHERQSAAGVSKVLPIAVFVVQLILFVKGTYYHDWALIAGAMIVNSGVLFSLYQIFKVNHAKKKSL